MALAALIAASRQIDDDHDVLRATLPVAGRTLVEHQARLATRAGAQLIVILVERLPATLAAAIDRLRRDGLRIEIARDAAAAADMIHPDEALLLFADGCVADAALVARVAGAPLPALLTVPPDADADAFERIDATARWGGVALIDGTRLRRTAAMLGDWDLQSTLLRQAVQEGAARVPSAAEPHALLVVANDLAALDGIDARLSMAARVRGGDWPSRFIFPAIDRLVGTALVRGAAEPGWLSAGGVGAALAAAALACAGWRWPALAVLLASGPMLFLGLRLAAARLRTVHDADRIMLARDAAAVVALAGLTHGLAVQHGWGAWPVALLLMGAKAAAMGVDRLRARLQLAGPGVTQPSVDALLWTMLPFAAAGWWLTGLGALAAYAAASAITTFRATLHELANTDEV